MIAWRETERCSPKMCSRMLPWTVAMVVGSPTVCERAAEQSENNSNSGKIRIQQDTGVLRMTEFAPAAMTDRRRAIA